MVLIGNNYYRITVVNYLKLVMMCISNSKTYKQLTFPRHHCRWLTQRKVRVGRGAPQFDGEGKQRRRPSVCPAGLVAPVLSRKRGLAQQVLPSRDAHAEVCAWGNAPEAFGRVVCKRASRGCYRAAKCEQERRGARQSVRHRSRAQAAAGVERRLFL